MWFGEGCDFFGVGFLDFLFCGFLFCFFSYCSEVFWEEGACAVAAKLLTSGYVLAKMVLGFFFSNASQNSEKRTPDL